MISPTSQAKITVDYQIDPKLGFFVPMTMHESHAALFVPDCDNRHLYELPAIQHERPAGRRRKVEPDVYRRAPFLVFDVASIQFRMRSARSRLFRSCISMWLLPRMPHRRQVHHLGVAAGAS